MNLISNAFKYTPQGGLIKVTAFVENDFLKFIINNTGKGIEEKDLDLIFDRYRILDNMNKNDCRDALSRNGLGLAICYNMVRLLHGQIHGNLSRIMKVWDMPERKRILIQKVQWNQQLNIHL